MIVKEKNKENGLKPLDAFEGYEMNKDVDNVGYAGSLQKEIADPFIESELKEIHIDSNDESNNNECRDQVISDGGETNNAVILEHKSLLNALLNELNPIDFNSNSDFGTDESLTRKHYLIISNDVILETAKKNRWALCMSDGFIYIYNGSFWKQLSKPELKQFLGNAALKLGVDKFEAKHYIFREELHKQFLSSAYLPKPNKIGNGVMINLKNGTFIITPESQYLKAFDYKDFITYQLQFDYTPSAVAPLFQNYLNRVLPDPDQQSVLAEYVGYVFVKQSTLKLEKALVLYGGGANGKSVFFDIINALLGKENVCNYTLQSLTDKSGYQRAMLSDKLLNYASEISTKMDSTFFKQLVSGEPIEARLPYNPPFTLIDYPKFIFNTNTLPRDVEQNEAFFRRFILIEFGVTIPEEERDPQLANKIIAGELTGVFNWVLNGLSRLLQNKRFTYSQSIDNAIKEYRLQSDSVHLFLDEERFEEDQTCEFPLKSLYESYKEFCHTSGYKSCSNKTFSERLRNMNLIVTRKTKGNVVGVKKVIVDGPTLATSAS